MPFAQLRDENGVTLFDVEYGPGPYASSTTRPNPYALVHSSGLYVWHPRFSQYRLVPQTTTRTITTWPTPPAPQTLPSIPEEGPL